MKKLHKWIRSYFKMSKSEANGFLILMFIMLFTTVCMFLYKNKSTPILESDQAILDSLLRDIEKSAFVDSVNEKPEFYRRFKKFDRKKSTSQFPEQRPIYKKEVLAKFDINLADTIQLKKLKGIGTVLSKRIVKYRHALGGFISKKQLSEVYGLQDSVLIQLDTMVFVSEAFQPKRIMINEASFFDLSRHPYIKKSLARAIDNYKFQHGPYDSSDELSNIRLMDSLTLAKITPYISF